MSLYGGALPVLILPLIGGSYEVLRAPMGEFLRRLSTRARPSSACGRSATQQIEALAEFVDRRPARRARGLLARHLHAQPLSRRPHRPRLGPPRARLAGPAGARPIRAAFRCWSALALAASFAPGVLGVAGTSFTGALLFAYLLAGLALMHFIARGRAPWLLWLVYAGAPAASGPTSALALMLGGLLEPVLKLRRRFGARPTDQPEPINSANNGATSMQVILLERIGRLGQMGDVVNVKDGYARNFLLPQKKALRATDGEPAPASRRIAPSSRRATSSSRRRPRPSPPSSTARASSPSARPATPASSTARSPPRDIAEVVTAGGFTVDRRQIVLDRPIKTLGLQPIRVALHPR